VNNVNPEIIDVALRSIWISGTATLLAAAWSIPIAMCLGLKKFRGRRPLKSMFNALIGIPTVSLGLIIFMIISRRGPLGFMGLLYTPTAIIIGQAILVTPIVVSFVTSALEAVSPKIKDLAKTLGASETQASFAVLGEAKSGTILAVTAAFNRAIAELGIALMLGGAILGETRVLSVTIAQETAGGEFGVAVAATAVLLAIVFVMSFIINYLRRE
jgi:tungstate transport system permease protein